MKIGNYGRMGGVREQEAEQRLTRRSGVAEETGGELLTLQREIHHGDTEDTEKKKIQPRIEPSAA